MSVRKTESRLPASLQPSDCGESVTSADGRCCMVSYVTAPLAVLRRNTYVVFVPDAGLASAVQSFEWSVSENGGAPAVSTTDFGQLDYVPTAEGYLELAVRLLDAGSSERARLSLVQQIGSLNADVEQRIADAIDKPGPGAGHPDVLRELGNDHNPYYLNVGLRVPEPGDAFERFVFSTVYDGALNRAPLARIEHLDRVASSLNTGAPDFVAAIAPGLGVSSVRLALAAMMLPPHHIPFTELPQNTAGNAAADEKLRAKVAALAENDRIDLFNLVRFPKSNIATCGRLLEALRDRFFSGVSFSDVVTKMSGKMADWIAINYRTGPLHRS